MELPFSHSSFTFSFPLHLLFHRFPQSTDLSKLNLCVPPLSLCLGIPAPSSPFPIVPRVLNPPPLCLVLGVPAPSFSVWASHLPFCSAGSPNLSSALCPPPMPLAHPMDGQAPSTTSATNTTPSSAHMPHPQRCCAGADTPEPGCAVGWS